MTTGPATSGPATPGAVTTPASGPSESGRPAWSTTAGRGHESAQPTGPRPGAAAVPSWTQDGTVFAARPDAGAVPRQQPSPPSSDLTPAVSGTPVVVPASGARPIPATPSSHPAGGPASGAPPTAALPLHPFGAPVTARPGAGQPTPPRAVAAPVPSAPAPVDAPRPAALADGTLSIRAVPAPPLTPTAGRTGALPVVAPPLTAAPSTVGRRPRPESAELPTVGPGTLAVPVARPAPELGAGERRGEEPREPRSRWSYTVVHVAILAVVALVLGVLLWALLNRMSDSTVGGTQDTAPPTGVQLVRLVE